MMFKKLLIIVLAIIAIGATLALALPATPA